MRKAMYKSAVTRKACFVFCAVAVSEVSLAGGFALIEQGAAGLGNAYAGAAAVSNDASTVWFNPAGMSEIKERQLLAAGHVIAVSSEFTDGGTILVTQQPVDPDFTTASPVDASGNSVIPNLYYVHPLNEDVTVGVGLSVPFGNSSSYDQAWVGRYQAIDSAVSAIDINPSIAYQVNETMSFGAGLSLQIMSAELGSAIDSALVCSSVAAVNPALDCAAVGLGSFGVAANDNFADIEGSGTALSFNFGFLFKPVDGAKVGIAYRHGVEHEIEGTASFTNNLILESILAQTPEGVPRPLVSADATAKASLPASVMFSGSYEMNDQLEFLADATFTNWSSFDELRVQFDNLAQPDSFNTLSFEDVWRLSAGLNYKHNDQLVVRAGVAYDQDPVPSAELRTARIPGNDRTWLAFGLGYEFTDSIGADFSFAHLIIDETPIANAGESPGLTTINGDFDTSVNIVSAQVKMQF